MKTFSQFMAAGLIFMLTSIVSGEPVAKIVGPEEVEPGNLVILRTEGTVGSGHQWLIIPESATGNFFPAVDSAGNHVVLFASSKAGTYTFILGVAEGDTVALAKHTLKQGKVDPEPDPDPNPDPDPDPDPDPGPIPGPTGLRVLILEETADRPSLPSYQAQILFDPEVRKYLDDKAGIGNWKIVDDDLTASQRSTWSDTWQEAYKQAIDLSKNKRPFVLITNGEEGVAQPLPKSVTEMMELLKKYGE